MTIPNQVKQFFNKKVADFLFSEDPVYKIRQWFLFYIHHLYFSQIPKREYEAESEPERASRPSEMINRVL